MSELLNIVISGPAPMDYFHLRKVAITEMVSALPTLCETRTFSYVI
jgi:hypothetical protein